MKVILILLLVAVFVVAPFATIWGLNTLFPALNIGYGLSEWAAVVLLAAALRANVTVDR